MPTIIKSLDEFIDTEKLRKLDSKIILGISKCLFRGMTSVNAAEHLTDTEEKKFNQLYNNLDDLFEPENIRIVKELIPDDYKFLQFVVTAKQLMTEGSQKELIHFLRISIGATVCSQIISLRGCDTPKPWYDFSIIAKSENTSFRPSTEYFPELIDFIYSELPFSDIGRIILLFNDVGQPTPMHFDHVQEGYNSEFILMVTNENKKFFVIDDNGDKEYLSSYTGWFSNLTDAGDNLNHPVFRNHGTEIPTKPCFSIRTDGKFTDEFIEKAGITF